MPSGQHRRRPNPPEKKACTGTHVHQAKEPNLDTMMRDFRVDSFGTDLIAGKGEGLIPAVAAAVIKPLVGKPAPTDIGRMIGPGGQFFVSLVNSAENLGFSSDIGMILLGLLPVSRLDHLLQIG